jgi:hypothetical protein
MQQVSTWTWLTRCAGAGALLLLACGLATAHFGSALQQPAVTTRDGSLVTLNRYVREDVPDIVLVGSSVTWRLKEEYFALPSVRNLALAGGSPVTGLEIVAAQPRLPKLVLIESNILTRETDAALVARFSADGAAQALWLRPVRSLVAALETWTHAPPSPAQARAEQQRLLGQPPATFDNRIHRDRAVAQMNEGDATAPVRANVLRIRQLIDDIVRRGSRVRLIAIPFEPEIERSRLVTSSQQIVRAAFPNEASWLEIDPPRGELRWADGVHLDERSALLVVRAIEAALGAELARRP